MKPACLEGHTDLVIPSSLLSRQAEFKSTFKYHQIQEHLPQCYLTAEQSSHKLGCSLDFPTYVNVALAPCFLLLRSCINIFCTFLHVVPVYGLNVNMYRMIWLDSMQMLLCLGIHMILINQHKYMATGWTCRCLTDSTRDQDWTGAKWQEFFHRRRESKNLLPLLKRWSISLSFLPWPRNITASFCLDCY